MTVIPFPVRPSPALDAALAELQKAFSASANLKRDRAEAKEIAEFKYVPGSYARLRKIWLSRRNHQRQGNTWAMRGDRLYIMIEIIRLRRDRMGNMSPLGRETFNFLIGLNKTLYGAP